MAMNAPSLAFMVTMLGSRLVTRIASPSMSMFHAHRQGKSSRNDLAIDLAMRGCTCYGSSVRVCDDGLREVVLERRLVIEMLISHKMFALWSYRRCDII